MKINKKTIALSFFGVLAAALIVWALSGRFAEKGDDHSDHEGHAHSEKDDAAHEDNVVHEDDVVHLDDAVLEEFGVEMETARSGTLRISRNLPGEVRANEDRLAHIVPRVSGVVLEVAKNLGDPVAAGEVMAVLESRELATAKSAFLAAKERVAIAETAFQREEALWKKKISAEMEFLQARQELAVARIDLRSAEHKLYALGIPHDRLAGLPEQSDDSLTRFEITAPLDGTVIYKHITLGEALKDDAQAFIVADLSDLWVDLSVYREDLPFIRKGQKVEISAGHGIPDAAGEISYVGALIGEQTRTALARVVLSNHNGCWKPGLYVTGKVIVEEREVPLLVPKSALLTIDGRPSLFVKTEDAYEPRPVTTGLSDATGVEITSGLSAGQIYVAKGAFTLKAQLSKETFGSGHNH